MKEEVFLNVYGEVDEFQYTVLMIKENGEWKVYNELGPEYGEGYGLTEAQIVHCLEYAELYM